MEICMYQEECKNKENILKCSRCENNPENFEQLEKQDIEGYVHDQKSRFYYIFKDNFEEY